MPAGQVNPSSRHFAGLSRKWLKSLRFYLTGTRKCGIISHNIDRGGSTRRGGTARETAAQGAATMSILAKITPLSDEEMKQLRESLERNASRAANADAALGPCFEDWPDDDSVESEPGIEHARGE